MFIDDHSMASNAIKANGIFVEPEHPAWQKLISQAPSDIYHTPGYLHACSIAEEGQLKVAMVTHNGHSLGLPLFIRNLPDYNEGFDAVSPYGYPSPVSDAETADEWRELGRKLVSFLRDQDVISVFIRMHPLLTSDPALEALSSLGELVFHGQTVYQQIDLGSTEIKNGIRSRFNTDINRLKREGWRCIQGNRSWLPSFIKIYYDTMDRLNASQGYYFTRDYFEMLYDKLPDKLNIHIILDPDNEPAAAGLFLNTKFVVQYHLGGTLSSHLSSSPAKLLFSDAMQWYQTHGLRWFHLGGGLGGKNDSLFQFKSGFSKRRAKFYTAQIIVDQHRYDTLSAQYRLKLKAREENADDHYFPAYRAPAKQP